MNGFQKFLSLAPVTLTVWLVLQSVLLIVLNRILPDRLFYTLN